MDDIVTRLRTTLAHADDVYDTMNQAADEIERLRALMEHGLTQGYDCKGCDLCTELKAIHEKAMRDA